MNQTVDHKSTSTIKKNITRSNRLRYIQQSNNGSLSSPWNNTVSIFIKENLEMQFAWDIWLEASNLQFWSSFHSWPCNNLWYWRGGPTVNHNETWDTTASLLTEICHNVATEPPLQSLTGETLNACSANTLLDIRARGFWNTSQDALFDVLVFYPSNCSSLFSLQETWTGQETWVWTCTHGVFTPLVFSSTGGMVYTYLGVGGEQLITWYVSQSRPVVLFECSWLTR